MTKPIHLRSHILTAKDRLASGRAALKQRHELNVPPGQVCVGMAELFDELILDLYRAALSDLQEEGSQGLDTQITLVAHGGYGRRDVAPFSDVDLMILHPPEMERRVAPLAERLLRDLFDAGLEVGLSVRTPGQASQMAFEDAIIFTSLTESRHLGGELELLLSWQEQFQRRTKRRIDSMLKIVSNTRRQEQAQFGETVYLLEPNVKRSRGGLRDLQFLRWVGFIRHGASDPETLRRMNFLSREDEENLRSGRDFLLRIRNEIHFYARKCNDQLDRTEQVRLSQVLGYEGTEGMLPVECFMRDYFRATREISRIANRFFSSAERGPRWKELLVPLLYHQFERDFRVGPGEIRANPRGLARLQTDLKEIVRLAELACLYGKRISPYTLDAIAPHVSSLSKELSAETAQHFRSLLNQSHLLAELLRQLHELGALERVLPPFSHARCLLQFNEYHKYTVDEHSLRAVDEATAFLPEEGILGRVYRGLKRKWILHLALLLHDLGKGFPRDHSEVGRDIAANMAERLRLSEEETELLKFLVHQHLLMTHLALWRDLNDEKMVVDFAVQVGSPEALQMLFIHSAADLAAVGPGVLNAWKIDLLAELYQKAMLHLSEESQEPEENLPALQKIEDVLRRVADENRHPWYRKQLAAFPSSYLRRNDADKIFTDLSSLSNLTPQQAFAEGTYLPERKTVEYQIGTHEEITPGVFYRLTGVLAGQGLQILSAEINTLADGLIFDRFLVLDPTFPGEPPPARIKQVCDSLVEALTHPRETAPVFRSYWKSGVRDEASLPKLPVQVRVDNNTSNKFTILEIFAADRLGLLYTIARTLFELGLSVGVAKIGTHLDQVVDVFYVTDQTGEKILDRTRLQVIREKLLSTVQALEKDSF